MALHQASRPFLEIAEPNPIQMRANPTSEFTPTPLSIFGYGLGQGACRKQRFDIHYLYGNWYQIHRVVPMALNRQIEWP